MGGAAAVELSNRGTRPELIRTWCSVVHAITRSAPTAAPTQTVAEHEPDYSDGAASTFLGTRSNGCLQGFRARPSAPVDARNVLILPW